MVNTVLTVVLMTGVTKVGGRATTDVKTGKAILSPQALFYKLL